MFDLFKIAKIGNMLEEVRINLEIDNSCKFNYTTPSVSERIDLPENNIVTYALICAVLSFLLFITLIFLKYFYKRN
jgi:hypothetical protein